MQFYGEFAHYYDRLMEDVDYTAWAEHIDSLIKQSGGIDVKNILELGCGTGSVTKELVRLGYEVTGVDISEEMLCEAQKKLGDENLKSILLCSDMRNLDFQSLSPDCVVCACDGFNYITDEDDLLRLFCGIYDTLPEGGVLVFDLSSFYKLSNVLGDNTFTLAEDDIAYIWENYYEPDAETVEMEITFFAKTNGLYKRFEEYHIQKAYRNETIKAMLSASGFRSIKALGDFGMEDASERSERVFFVCVK
ncbi:MAG: methyltransferase domain-containing protein [Peptoclostridium sp.]|uniref:class I SAM-dependent DNA methyltransferase n=1 Tax=Peptoclostridium sp. TaxID=1904860 RepID=UPI00139B4CB1|nr:class I SAM-dependent methyltransferase [Peptoclostridium sp.]MZQ76434.1 methyltransferase domain-containing protein [Peptoclostridium sp.]